VLFEKPIVLQLVKCFCLSKTPEPTLGPTQPLYLGLKRPWLEINNSPPFSDKDKDERSYTSTPAMFLHSLTEATLPYL